jgi:hypothetical protein
MKCILNAITLDLFVYLLWPQIKMEPELIIMILKI